MENRARARGVRQPALPLHQDEECMDAEWLHARALAGRTFAAPRVEDVTLQEPPARNSRCAHADSTRLGFDIRTRNTSDDLCGYFALSEGKPECPPTKEHANSATRGTSADTPSLPSQKKSRKRAHYLSHQERCAIIERITGGEQQAALAREFGVTRAAVCHIHKHRDEILARPIPRIADHGDNNGDPPGGSSMVCEIQGRVAMLLLTSLRDQRTNSQDFRCTAGRLIVLLIEEAMGMLGIQSVEITTPGGQVCSGLANRYTFCGVALGDEGLPFSVLFQQIEVNVSQGSIRVELEEHEDQKFWRLELLDLPLNVTEGKVLLFTASCGTGHAECEALQALCDVGVNERSITLVAMVCASSGTATICRHFPHVKIITAAAEDAVDPETGMLFPGIGDFVARYNGV